MVFSIRIFRCTPARQALLLALVLLGVGEVSAQQLRVGAFKVDATPPVGSPAAYAPVIRIVDSLSARGVVILSDQKPIVLCVVDWIGIANEGNEAWKARLAKAAHTTVDRVSVHAIHQHDGAGCDFTTERILQQYGLGGVRFDNTFLNGVIDNAAKAVEKACREAQPVTHIGFGEAKVEKVASNRRILGDDGKVKITRWSSSRDSAAIAAPEGLIDPWLKCVSFWNKDAPVAVMTYYATHPQTLATYGRGEVTSEFVGIARNNREEKLGFPHVHFNGAGGNITAGKYNDGSVAAAAALAVRLEAGHKQAWENTKKTPVSARDLVWKNVEIQLPLAEDMIEENLRRDVGNKERSLSERYQAAESLGYYVHRQSGEKMDVSSLRLGKVWLLQLPGEAFIEYQLAAQKMRPNEHVCTAAYAEYGPGYVCTEIAFQQGGYESGKYVSRGGPATERVLMKAIAEVLKK